MQLFSWTVTSTTFRQPRYTRRTRSQIHKSHSCHTNMLVDLYVSTSINSSKWKVFNNYIPCISWKCWINRSVISKQRAYAHLLQHQLSSSALKSNGSSKTFTFTSPHTHKPKQFYSGKNWKCPKTRFNYAVRKISIYLLMICSRTVVIVNFVSV